MAKPKTYHSSPRFHCFLFFISPSQFYLLRFSSSPSYSQFKPPRKPPTITHPSGLNALILVLLLFPLSFLILSKFPSLSISFHPKVSIGAPTLWEPALTPLPVHEIAGNLTEEEAGFWRQPDGLSHQPCIEFSVGYRRESARIVKERSRFLVALVSGGLNQQRNQIVDVVVIARILGAALVVPVLKTSVVWGDKSKFSEIFDVDHFIRALQSDVHIVHSLPPTYQIRRPSTEGSIPFNVSPLWIRARFLKQLNEDGVLVLQGLDSKLSKDLPLDLQKLRCKVAFHALRFATPIRELGDKLARRMWDKGPYIALHLRLEEDVWVRTGCSPGLGPEHDELIIRARMSRSELLTDRLNLTSHQRRLAGHCPLNARELARLLRVLGAPRGARVFWSGDAPLGGERALWPLREEFPSLMSMEALASGAELEPYANKSSAIAALDYIVALSSDVFVPSHGGNMASLMQGQRAYAGHRKHIRPIKRALFALLAEAGRVFEGELGNAVRRAHNGQMGQPEERTRGKGRDVLAYPVPECVCKKGRFHSLLGSRS